MTVSTYRLQRVPQPGPYFRMPVLVTAVARLVHDVVSAVVRFVAASNTFVPSVVKNVVTAVTKVLTTVLTVVVAVVQGLFKVRERMT
jgi:phage-related protein